VTGIESIKADRGVLVEELFWNHGPASVSQTKWLDQSATYDMVCSGAGCQCRTRAFRHLVGMIIDMRNRIDSFILTLAGALSGAIIAMLSPKALSGGWHTAILAFCVLAGAGAGFILKKILGRV